MSKRDTTGSPGTGARRPLARADLLRVAQRLAVPVDVVEKDHVLSYVLAGIAGVRSLEGLKFKGGTALKKMIFGASYRFSEDLDISALGAPAGPAIEPLIAQALRSAQELMEERGASASNSTVRRNAGRTRAGRTPSECGRRFRGRVCRWCV